LYSILNQTYFGPDPEVCFIEKLKEYSGFVNDCIDAPLQMDTSQIPVAIPPNCFICNASLNGDVVRDHDHISGQFRGFSHSLCNLKFTKIKKVMPVVFHNLEGYDAHLFIEQLLLNSRDVSIIPKSKEKYLAIQAKLLDPDGGILPVSLKFVDSMHFLSGSLASNASILSEFKFIKDLELTKKQIFPYSYITSPAKLREPLPHNPM
jgi:hypothetical protein